MWTKYFDKGKVSKLWTIVAWQAFYGTGLMDIEGQLARRSMT
jgi:hypothetical protein